MKQKSSPWHFSFPHPESFSVSIEKISPTTHSPQKIQPSHTVKIGHYGNGDQNQRIPQYHLGCILVARYGRQHGHAGGGIVLVLAIARLQKWEGVQKNRTSASCMGTGVNTGSTAAAPASTAKLPDSANDNIHPGTPL